jgi:ribosomal protein L15
LKDMSLSNLQPAFGSNKKGKRIGRGAGSGKGGTSTRGHKGAKSRSGYKAKVGFEGGQMPLQRRVPKYGFKNNNRVEYKAINLSDLQVYAEANNVETITVADLVAAGLVGKKKLVKVPVINGTIPHKQEMRFGGSEVMIRPAAAGTGIIAGGAMRAVLESVGIKNVLAKSKGSSNPHNLVKATVGALCELRDAYTVAQTRGISLKQVFNG